MKNLLFIPVVAFIFSCASHHPVPAKPFVANDVCSRQSLDYLQMKEGRNLKYTGPVIDPLAVRAEAEKLASGVQSCFNTELTKTTVPQNINLCLVAGTDAQGNIEYSEFSTREVKFSDDFYKCVGVVKEALKLKKYKNLSLTQPFNLYTK